MTKRIGAAEAKAHLSELLSKVEHSGERYIIERHGKPVAALVQIDELKRLEEPALPADKAKGFLALVGSWPEVTDAEIDDLLRIVYESRASDTGRPVLLEP